MKKYLIILFSFFCLKGLAQEEEHKGIVYSLASDKGNIVRFLPESEDMAGLRDVLLNTKRFIIKRTGATRGKESTEVIGTVDFPRNLSHFEKWVSAEDLLQFRAEKTDKELEVILKNEDDMAKMFLFSEIKYEFLLAYGLAFLDVNVSKGDFFQYEVFREDLSGSQEITGTSALFAKEGNMELDRVKITSETVIPLDSVIKFRWVVQLPEIESIDFESISDSLLATTGRYRTYRGNANYRNALSLYNRYGLTTNNTHFSIYYRKNEDTEWALAQKLLPSQDSTGAIFLEVFVPCMPEDYVEAVVVPHDLANNSGPKSAIAQALALTPNNVKLITYVNAKDSTNAIILNWEKLPEKPYYTGIEIAKSWLNNEPKVVAVLNPGEVSYTDNDIFPAGRQISYYVRALFNGVNGISQEIPSTIVHSCTTFSKPSVPYNVQLIEEGEKVNISWEAEENPSFFSYHVFRGVNPENMALISGNVSERFFYDSVQNLSRSVTYYYAVMAMSVTQDTSQLSDKVEFRLKDGEIINPPPMVGFEVLNKKAYLTWDDIKLNDTNIAGYILQRNEGNGFKNLHTDVLEENIFIDETFEINKEMFYRVASISINGDTSAFSPATTAPNLNIEFDMPVVSNIRIDDLEKSVRVAWPTVLEGRISKFRVYKRLRSNPEFTLLKEVNVGVFEIEDTAVESGKVYVYSVTAVSADNKESALFEEQAVHKD